MSERGPGAASTSRQGFWLAQAAVALAAALLLGYNLGTRYLWQDEAATAVMAERMLRHGKPLAYDGRNLITMDIYDAKEADELASMPPQQVVNYLVQRGDFKADTTWVAQPWGQFVATALSLAIFGKGSLAARLPFALCGIATVVLLFRLIVQRFRDWPMALVAVFLLLGNVFWVLHVRQCRYYALSSLFLVLTFIAYLRWTDGKRLAALGFVVSAWCLFQSDYGCFWPILAVLFGHAIWSGAISRQKCLLTFGAIAVAIAPWVYYYELASRVKPRYTSLESSVLGSLFNFNHFQFPILALVPLVILMFGKPVHRAGVAGRRLVGLATCLCLALLVWVPTVSPFPFYRYLMPVTPLAALALAYVILGSIDLMFAGRAANDLRVVAALPLAALFTLTPLAALPVSLFIPSQHRPLQQFGILVRPELSAIYLDVIEDGPDPNRDVIEVLASRIQAGDEVLVNYEDVPFMFYTDATVRGGMCAFRTEAPDNGRLRFAVIRPNLRIGHAALMRELARHRWRPIYERILALRWGHVPDPRFHRFQRYEAPPDTIILEALGPLAPASETKASP